jgi:hypothetical protein
MERFEARIRPADRIEHFCRSIPAPIVHENYLEQLTGRHQNLKQARVQRLDNGLLIIDRDYY